MNTPNVEFLNVPVCSMPVIPCRQHMGSSAVLRARRSALVLAAKHRRAHSIGRGCRDHTCVMAIVALQNASPVLFSFVRFESNLFYNTQETQTQKNDWTRILKFEFCDFLEFFEIFKKTSCGPSAATVDHYGRAKLDHSRVLVTKFRQNRSTLKGRSAGQRHTDKLGWKSWPFRFAIRPTDRCTHHYTLQLLLRAK